MGPLTPKMKDSCGFPYCWWFRIPAHQLRLVGYPVIYMVFAPSQVVGLGISEPSTACGFPHRGQSSKGLFVHGFSVFLSQGFRESPQIKGKEMGPWNCKTTPHFPKKSETNEGKELNCRTKNEIWSCSFQDSTDMKTLKSMSECFYHDQFGLLDSTCVPFAIDFTRFKLRTQDPLITFFLTRVVWVGQFENTETSRNALDVLVSLEISHVFDGANC